MACPSTPPNSGVNVAADRTSRAGEETGSEAADSHKGCCSCPLVLLRYEDAKERHWQRRWLRKRAGRAIALGNTSRETVHLEGRWEWTARRCLARLLDAGSEHDGCCSAARHTEQLVEETAAVHLAPV